MFQVNLARISQNNMFRVIYVVQSRSRYSFSTEGYLWTHLSRKYLHESIFLRDSCEIDLKHCYSWVFRLWHFDFHTYSQRRFCSSSYMSQEILRHCLYRWAVISSSFEEDTSLQWLTPRKFLRLRRKTTQNFLAYGAKMPPPSPVT